MREREREEEEEEEEPTQTVLTLLSQNNPFPWISITISFVFPSSGHVGVTLKVTASIPVSWTVQLFSVASTSAFPICVILNDKPFGFAYEIVT